MTLVEIKVHIQKYINLKDNISILDNVGQLNLAEIKEGILTIWVTWSPGFNNCIRTLKLLNDRNYLGKIILIDIDLVSPDFQLKTFGRVILNGWGEIFLIKNGLIVKEFIGKDSATHYELFQEE